MGVIVHPADFPPLYCSVTAHRHILVLSRKTKRSPPRKSLFLFLDSHHFVAVQDAERIEGEFQLLSDVKCFASPLLLRSSSSFPSSYSFYSYSFPTRRKERSGVEGEEEGEEREGGRSGRGVRVSVSRAFLCSSDGWWIDM